MAVTGPLYADLYPITDGAGRLTFLTREQHTALFAPRPFDLGLVHVNCFGLGFPKTKDRPARFKSGPLLTFVCGCEWWLTKPPEFRETCTEHHLMKGVA